MNVYKEIKEIAKAMAKVKYLAEKMGEKIDTEEIDWASSEFVNLNEEDIKHFGFEGTTEDYFVDQWMDYCEDNYRCFLYFKTDVPGQYVRVVRNPE